MCIRDSIASTTSLIFSVCFLMPACDFSTIALSYKSGNAIFCLATAEISTSLACGLASISSTISSSGCSQFCIPHLSVDKLSLNMSLCFFPSPFITFSTPFSRSTGDSSSFSKESELYPSSGS
eukprot:TRINITY_DN22796_c0_g1_i2.p2 TRINITY_DN22796_c0_g1~~TRINITY_DN22796_c0_g1_i2.p2  ORF type:complete len:123 (-),score=4.70 TRINITY_DN22796_c0_g1_i2:526-894(-)